MATHQSEGKTGKPSEQTAQTTANSYVYDCKENELFLSLRNSPSTMRKRRSPELHVAEQEPCNYGYRNFFLSYCK